MDKVEMEIGGRKLIIETGRIAKQADAAVTIQYADTVVLVSVVAAKKVIEDIDFFPLTVDYREKTYAAGKIPGGFYKREGRPRDAEILAGRLIDRSLRPLFPKGFRKEVQITAFTLSFDQQNDPDLLAIIGASAALSISDIPFKGAVGAVRIGRVKDGFVVNPTISMLEEGDLELVIAGTKKGVLMIEGGAKEVPEEVVLEAISLGQEIIGKIVELQENLALKCGKPKGEIPLLAVNRELEMEIRTLVTSKVEEVILIGDKLAREKRREEIFKEVLEDLKERAQGRENEVKAVIEQIERELVRHNIIELGRRVDGRGLKDIRPLSCEIGILPRTHGSALFTRGQTQCLAVTTLGTAEDEQIIDDLEAEYKKTFMLHYNFPPFSVGEVGALRGPGRREIGHGALAERALKPIIPPPEEFPYTIRIVSDILESNGSSSMASVCGGTLSLMDAGVSIKAPVAGIGMGLVKEGEKVAVLSDILGLEDHWGDMDFKVAGTRSGITAIQMDIKIEGISLEIMKEALEQAKEGRLFILDKMLEAIAQPRRTLSEYAPRIISLQIKPDRIRDVIGPGGKTIKKIIEETGVKIDIEDNGKVSIASVDERAARAAVEMIEYLTAEVEVGKVYLGKVLRTTNFGAFVEILPGKEGLVHISQLADYRVHRVEDIVKEGDQVLVKVMDIDSQGRISLSRKEALRQKEREERAKREKRR